MDSQSTQRQGRSGDENYTEEVEQAQYESQLIERVTTLAVSAGMGPVEVAELVNTAQAHFKKAATWQHTLERIMVSSLVVGFLVHATVSRAALLLFTCIEVGGSS